MAEKRIRTNIEIAIDPHSLFWVYNAEIDYCDPLTILLSAEEGDEIAEDLLDKDNFRYHNTGNR